MALSKLVNKLFNVWHNAECTGSQESAAVWCSLAMSMCLSGHQTVCLYKHCQLTAIKQWVQNRGKFLHIFLVSSCSYSHQPVFKFYSPSLSPSKLQKKHWRHDGNIQKYQVYQFTNSKDTYTGMQLTTLFLWEGLSFDLSTDLTILTPACAEQSNILCLTS